VALRSSEEAATFAEGAAATEARLSSQVRALSFELGVAKAQAATVPEAGGAHLDLAVDVATLRQFLADATARANALEADLESCRAAADAGAEASRASLEANRRAASEAQRLAEASAAKEQQASAEASKWREEAEGHRRKLRAIAVKTRHIALPNFSPIASLHPRPSYPLPSQQSTLLTHTPQHHRQCHCSLSLSLSHTHTHTHAHTHIPQHHRH